MSILFFEEYKNSQTQETVDQLVSDYFADNFKKKESNLPASHVVIYSTKGEIITSEFDDENDIPEVNGNILAMILSRDESIITEEDELLIDKYKEENKEFTLFVMGIGDDGQVSMVSKG
jgi:hypothetical protein